MSTAKDEEQLEAFLDLVQKHNGGKEVRKTVSDLIERLREASFDAGYRDGYNAGFNVGIDQQHVGG